MDLRRGDISQHPRRLFMAIMNTNIMDIVDITTITSMKDHLVDPGTVLIASATTSGMIP
jgi:hypothetical protein